jgi:hypothetical protein
MDVLQGYSAAKTLQKKAEKDLKAALKDSKAGKKSSKTPMKDSKVGKKSSKTPMKDSKVPKKEPILPLALVVELFHPPDDLVNWNLVLEHTAQTLLVPFLHHKVVGNLHSPGIRPARQCRNKRWPQEYCF